MTTAFGAEEKFTVTAYDLNTNTKLAQLPHTGQLSFGCRLNDAGPLKLDLNLQDPDVQTNVSSILNMDGTPFACYVDLNGSIVWGGIAWTGAYKKSTGILEVGGAEVLSWSSQRVQAKDYSAQTYPSGVDPAAFVRLVITDAQAAGAGASIGLQVVLVSGTNQPNFIPGYPIAQHSTLSSLISDMCKTLWPGTGGIDVTQSSQYNTAGLPVTTLTVWTPRAGRTGDNSGVVFDLDSTIDYDWPTDATGGATTFIVTGAGNGTSMPIATVQAPGVPVGGLGNSPRLDMVINHSQIQTQSQISAMARGDAAMFGGPVIVPKVTIPTLNLLGEFIPGDDARLYTAGDERHPNGLDEIWRIISYDVTVPEGGVATMDVTFNQPPVY